MNKHKQQHQKPASVRKMMYLQVFVYSVFVVCSWLHRHGRFSRTVGVPIGLSYSSNEQCMFQHRSVGNVGTLCISPSLIALILCAVILSCLFPVRWGRVRDACAMWVGHVRRIGSLLPDAFLFLATRLFSLALSCHRYLCSVASHYHILQHICLETNAYG
jgi:hypothetical protein